MSDLVLLSSDAGVATLTFNDPPRKNVMSEALADAFSDAIDAVARDGSLRALVITGGDGVFSSGGDLAMLERLCAVGDTSVTKAFMLGYYERFLKLLRLPIPVVAAVSGPAIGAGFCVALAADALIVDERAKLALNFVKLGLHPGMAATLLGPLRFGSARATELLLSGRLFSGAECTSYGHGVATPRERVLPLAYETAAALSAGQPLAIAATLRSLRPDNAVLAQALDREASAQALSYAGDEMRAALQTLKLEALNRKPRAEGK